MVQAGDKPPAASQVVSMGVPKVRSAAFCRCFLLVKSAFPSARNSPKCTPTPTPAHCTQVLGVLPAFWDRQPFLVGTLGHGMALSVKSLNCASCDGGHSTCHGSGGDKCPHCTPSARHSCTYCQIKKQGSMMLCAGLFTRWSLRHGLLRHSAAWLWSGLTRDLGLANATLVVQ